MDKSAYALILFMAFLLMLAMIPKLVRWLQSRHVSPGLTQELRVMSAVAVGPQHKVVVVALGSGQAQTQLVLGVGPQAVHCLHTLPALTPAVGQQRSA